MQSGPEREGWQCGHLIKVSNINMWLEQRTDTAEEVGEMRCLLPQSQWAAPHNFRTIPHSVTSDNYSLPQIKKLISSSGKSLQDSVRNLNTGNSFWFFGEHWFYSFLNTHSFFCFFLMTMQVFVSETCVRPRQHIDFALWRPLKDSDSRDKAYEQPESTRWLQRASYFPITKAE